jgi:hypothetical protein
MVTVSLLSFIKNLMKTTWGQRLTFAMLEVTENFWG